MKNGRSFWTRAPLVLGLAAAVAAVAAVLFAAFALPAVHSEPRDVQVAVAGEATDVRSLQERLNGALPGAFDLIPAGSTHAARDLVRQRGAYAAVVLEGTPAQVRRVVLASAASPAVAALIEQAFAEGRADEAGVPVEDLAPLPTDDPRGAGLAAVLLPLTIVGVVATVAGLQLLPQPGLRLAAALLTSATAGTALWAVLDPALGAVGQGSSAGTWSSLVLGAAALLLALGGAAALLGARGLALVTLVFLLLGNPLSGAAGAPELLPDGWSTLGQALPQGAVTSLLRSAVGFGGTGAMAPTLVLIAWATAGLALFAAAILRARGGEADQPDTGPPDARVTADGRPLDDSLRLPRPGGTSTTHKEMA